MPPLPENTYTQISALFLLMRLLGAIYLIAFASIGIQIEGLAASGQTDHLSAGAELTNRAWPSWFAMRRLGRLFSARIAENCLANAVNISHNFRIICGD